MNHLIILAHIFQFNVVGVDLTLETCCKDAVQGRATPLHAKLDDRSVRCVFSLVVSGWVPQLDDVVGTGGDYESVCLIVPLDSDEVGSDERAACDARLARRHAHHKLACLGVVDFETLCIPFHHNKVLF